MRRLTVLSSTPGKIVNGRFVPNKVTDRAKRYRANRNAPRQKRCFACGAPRPRTVHHIDGIEDNSNPENLTKACTSCNVRIANVMRKAGLGKKTRQYNPKAKVSKRMGAAKSLGAYLSALAIVKGTQPGNVAQAVRTIQGTTPAQRSEYAEQIWRIRRERYGPTGRQDSLPF